MILEIGRFSADRYFSSRICFQAELAKTEGILAGTSSGAALYAAVVLLPDIGDLYYSTPLFVE